MVETYKHYKYSVNNIHQEPLGKRKLNSEKYKRCVIKKIKVMI